ncbi:iron-siderophore ABC transporter substrate-binding protein [Pseudonocardia spirodelae]|uniref:Iron-siderophore ABC transporter substrate-binding protein n=1 Tax=Pseudonocardia spirodelae TaxID=3133431 RepID=A0ABU8TB73_9PSEU
MELTRRQMLLGSLAAAGGAVLAGCGAGGGSAAGGGAGTTAAAGFPVTIEGKLGTATVPQAPRRVASVGYTDHDAILALGVAPVAARYWYGAENTVVQPWASAAARALDAAPAVLTMSSIEPEKIAAQRPDLVVGVYSDLDAQNYPVVSAIAPTVGPAKGFHDYGAPWQEQTRLVGRALGRTDEADRLVGELEARFAAVRDANPQWAGKQVAVATRGADSLSVFASQDPRSRFFTSLGFVVPPRYDELAGQSFYAELSFEQYAELDHDLVVWDQLSFTPGGRATVERDPLLSRLPAMREGRAVFLEGGTELAFAWQTVLSLPAVLDAVVPALERAIPRA